MGTGIVEQFPSTFNCYNHSCFCAINPLPLWQYHEYPHTNTHWTQGLKIVIDSADVGINLFLSLLEKQMTMVKRFCWNLHRLFIFLNNYLSLLLPAM